MPKFYCEVIEFLISLGCKTLVGDESFLTHHINGKLDGCIILHVDDFLLSGENDFRVMVRDAIADKFKISKHEKDDFKFTGVDVSRVENGNIFIGQEIYKTSLELIDVLEGDDEKSLTKEEFRQFRGASGKLQWMAEMTRPDLSYDCLDMSCHGKDATETDLKTMDKVINTAKALKSTVKYSHIGKLDDLKILAVTDAAYLKLEQKTRSVMGRIIFLSNKEETKVVPLMWKSKCIPMVCKSGKDV